MAIKRTLILLCLVLFAGQPCFAQSGDAAEDDSEATPDSQRKQYRVELIVFEYLGPDSSAGEQFDSLIVSDYFPTESFDIQEYNRINEMVSYTDMKHLAGALQRVSDSEQYRIMERLAWTQPLLSKQEAIDIDMGQESAGAVRTVDETTRGPASNRLSGSVTVYGDFHLYVKLDIKAQLARRAGPGQDEASGEQSSDNGLTSLASSESGPSRQGERGFFTYHIAERRRIKLEDFHYFDHPYLGAIVTVWRHEDASASR